MAEKELSKKLGEVEVDGLVTAIDPHIVIGAGVIRKASSGTLKLTRGTVLAKSTGTAGDNKLVVLGTAASGDTETLTANCILCDDRLVNLCSLLDYSTLHQNGIINFCTFFNNNFWSNNAVSYSSIDFRAITYDTALNLCRICNILRRLVIRFSIYLPELFIQIKYRNDINQLHICFPVGMKCSNILPISIKFIAEYSVTTLMTIWNDMHTKVAIWNIFICDQCLTKHRPCKYVNTHGS